MSRSMAYVEPYFVCVQSGRLNYLIELLAKNPKGVNISDETGQTILHYACALGKVDIVIHLLNRHDCQLLQQEQLFGYTPLHMACLYDQPIIVPELLKKLRSNPGGVNIVDKLGWSALHHSARNGNLEICKLLISHDCRPEVENKLGKTACHYAAQYGHEHVLQYIFDYVEARVTPPVVSESALEAPTLLHSAAFGNRVNIVDWLKQKAYPATIKCRRVIDFDVNRSREEFAEDVAVARGYGALRGNLSAYRVRCEEWIADIAKSQVALDRIKLCICGHPRVGKSAMRQSLNRPYLQTLLGRANVEETPDHDFNRATSGIEISSMQLSGKDVFSVWDFAGQIDSFVTHQFFISTQSTVFTVLIDLSRPVEEQRAQLMRWLGFIKIKNLGQVSITSNTRDMEKDKVFMPVPNKALSTLNASKRKPSVRRSTVLNEEPVAAEDMFGSTLQPVPIIIVGSHLDCIPTAKQAETVATTQALVDEMRQLFEQYLNISPCLYPLNCLRAVTPEIKLLKEHLCEVRAQLLEVQPLYPRVTELVARRIELLRGEQPHLKVLLWDKMRAMVREEVNRLLSERQLMFICNCLANAGVLAYFDQGALGKYVFVDPGWLCQDVLGKTLAPGNFPVAHIATTRSTQISEEILQSMFTKPIDQNHIPIIIELLQYFEICHRHKSSGLYEFPSFITDALERKLWKHEQRFVAYCGRRHVCADVTDAFPPGFFPRLQVQVSGAFLQEKLFLFKGSFIVDVADHQCLVSINANSTFIDLICRTQVGSARSCLLLVDTIQNMIANLIRDFCPTIFLHLRILSCSDLILHRNEPHSYPVNEVISLNSKGESITNQVTNAHETLVDLLYLGDVSLQKSQSGKNMKVAYIPEDIISKIQELLEDDDKDWQVLAKALNLEKYVQVLKSKAPNSTRFLLLKWSEKPRWNVHSLLYAFKEIKREDLYNFARARLT